MVLCLHLLQLCSKCSLFWIGVFFSFRILRTVFPSMTSFEGSTPFVFLSERQPLAADILPALIILSNFLTSSFTSSFLTSS